jgi:hypothetical protein
LELQIKEGCELPDTRKFDANAVALLMRADAKPGASTSAAALHNPLDAAAIIEVESASLVKNSPQGAPRWSEILAGFVNVRVREATKSGDIVAKVAGSHAFRSLSLRAHTSGSALPAPARYEDGALSASLSLPQERELGTITCGIPESSKDQADTLQFIELVAAVDAPRFARLVLLDGAMIASDFRTSKAASRSLLATCVPHFSQPPAGSAVDGVPDIAELTLHSEWYPDANWQLALPFAPARVHVFIGPDDRMGQVNCLRQGPVVLRPLQVLGAADRVVEKVTIGASEYVRDRDFERRFGDWIWTCQSQLAPEPKLKGLAQFVGKRTEEELEFVEPHLSIKQQVGRSCYVDENQPAQELPKSDRDECVPRDKSWLLKWQAFVPPGCALGSLKTCKRIGK